MAKKGLRFDKGGSKSRKEKEKKHKIDKKVKARFDKSFDDDDDFNREEFIIVGKNPVLEALRSDLQVERILVLRDNSDHVLKDIQDKAKQKGYLVSSVDRKKLEALAQGRPHQGVVALMTPFPYKDFDEAVEELEEKKEATVVLMDHITDPHNFGAIVRSAEVLGADLVVFPQRRSAGLSPAAVKASSGAAAYIGLSKVTNLSQAIGKLKEKGFWIAGADMEGEAYYNANLTGKVGIVLGSEGGGISPKLEKLCDFKVSIPEYGKVDSLNVSAAAAIILSEIAKQQHQ